MFFPKVLRLGVFRSNSHHVIRGICWVLSIQSQQRSIDKVEELQRKIGQTDETVSQLSKDHTRLLEEPKGIQSFIDILPEEILICIFQFVCSPPEFGSFPQKRRSLVVVGRPGKWRRHGNGPKMKVTLSRIESANEEGRDYDEYGMKLALTRVSANWRRIVMSVPQLWTSVRLHIRKATIERDIISLRQFFEYSGQLPLTLSIRFPIYQSTQHGHLIHPSIDPLLVKNLGRIKNLHLNFPQLAWFTYFPQLGRMTHFFLANARHLPPDFSLSDIFPLSELTLVDHSAKFSSPYLTILNLHRVPLNTMFHAVTHCPNLIELHLRTASRIRIQDVDDVPPEETFTLQSLEVLEWTTTINQTLDTTWETALLNHINTPSLRALSFIQPPEYSSHKIERIPSFREAVASFFSRLPTTLLSLEFVGIRKEPTGENNLLTLVNHNLRDDCHIESLSFFDCHFRFLAGILHNLACFPRFPRLRRIMVDKIFWPTQDSPSNDAEEEQQQQQREWDTSLAYTFLEMVVKRLDAPEKRLALYMSQSGRDVEWLSYIRSELAALKLDRQLDIFVKSEPVMI